MNPEKYGIKPGQCDKRPWGNMCCFHPGTTICPPPPYTINHSTLLLDWFCCFCGRKQHGEFYDMKHPDWLTEIHKKAEEVRKSKIANAVQRAGDPAWHP